MRKLIPLVAATAVAASLAGGALAADPAPPTVVPFPSPTVGPLFVTAHTFAGTAAQNNFAPGAQVVFKASALDGKSLKPLTPAGVRYFYVAIPNQPNVKLKYDAQAGWSGTWTVPATYPLGLVPFKVLVKTTDKRIGQFVQMPVSSAQLTIMTSPPAPPAAGPTAALQQAGNLSLYVDTVNGSRPAGAPARTIGCTQTNAFKRGEQVVFRAWGVDPTKGDILSSDNVDSAVASIPGQADLPLAWGAHGNTGAKVWFWANGWNIPKDYALGDTVLTVTFKTDSGRTGTVKIPVTIVP